MCKKMILLTAFAARGDDLRYLYVEVCRVKGPGSDEPGFGSTEIIRDQLPGSFHQKLTVLLGWHSIFLGLGAGCDKMSKYACVF